MKTTPIKLFAGIACGAFVTFGAHAADVKQLMSKPLPELPGSEAVMLEVSYPPGEKDRAHRHDAHAFVYVLEGTIQMQLQGKSMTTVKAGETFYEGPDDVHLIGRNASNSEPARFVVILIKKQGAAVVKPIGEAK
ncbi:cupin domain-containing protein [Variovorax sp. OV329]|uniref:cupin domain-containing protein n=1 Tax=Variovorax sp. OV329 TaxID=1882825 RepID=UPI0008E682B9|nr:cupin domain-containing protein [Variovorax sp. OV329]SFN50181.1 Cupin domain protein [Variovorax sp. OV329]